MTQRRILVLGGAGFLGSHLCDRLLASGSEVIAIDNLQTGSLDNIAHLRGRADFTFVEHDVVDEFKMRVDRIYNLACPASPPQYQIDPVKTTLTSVLGTLNSMKLAERCGARVLLASTSEVYGDPEVHPQPESYRGSVSTIGPRACYDEGKRCAESLTMDFARRGVDVRIARIFNTYGPRMDPWDGRIVSNFVCQALADEALTVYGDGSQTRSFCFVDDMVDGLVRLMEHEPVTGPVNLGNPEELSVLQVARLVLELTGKNVPIVHEPLPIDDPRTRRPVIALATELLGFQPRVRFRDGLSRTIEYFRRTISRRLPTHSQPQLIEPRPGKSVQPTNGASG